MSRHRKLLWLIVVPALTLVPGALAAPTASASEVTWPGGWICADGTLAAGERTGTVPVRTPLNFSIRPCAGTVPVVVAKARWAIALYYSGSTVLGPGAYAYSNGIRPFAAEGDTAGSTFGFPDGSLSAGVVGDMQAACLIIQPTRRVACVRLGTADAAGTIVIEPLPVSDPLVTRVVQVLEPQYPDPECAACV